MSGIDVDYCGVRRAEFVRMSKGLRVHLLSQRQIVSASLRQADKFL